MVGLEAMGYERPVIGFAVGGIPDWLSHEQTGFLAQEQNIEELAKHIQRLLSDKKLAQKMGKAGKKRLKDEFNLKKNLSGLERIFMRAIKARQK
jgi:glycosyltransferase involved in cell wall biosynthesis